MKSVCIRRAVLLVLVAVMGVFLWVPQTGLVSQAKTTGTTAASSTAQATTTAGKTGSSSAAASASVTGSTTTSTTQVTGNTEVISSLEDLAFLSIPAPSCDITYDLGGGRTFELDPAMALSLMKTNADGSYYIDQTTNYYVVDSGKVRSFLAALEKLQPLTSDKYSFTTTGGQTKVLTNVSYKKRTFDIEKELTYLRGAIMTGAQGVHQPAEVLPKDDYVEIDLTSQKAWYYKNGEQLWSSSIVSGNTSNDHGTPEGVYYINSKVRDTKLIGEDYESPVSYWMPFIGNSIGLHDATWRWSFGGEIYKTSGSHGCVNLPLNNASTLFDLVSVGTPVIVYYEDGTAAK